jgi:hypothetical protein
MRQAAARVYPRYPRVLNLLRDHRTGDGAIRLLPKVKSIAVTLSPQGNTADL